MKYKIAFLLFSIFHFGEVSADYIPMSKYDLVLNSSLIVTGTVRYVEEGRFGTYKQKAYVEVDSVIKGQTPKNIVIFGKTGFICDLTHFKRGKYLLFINSAATDLNYMEVLPYYTSPGFGDGLFHVEGGSLWWSVTGDDHKGAAYYPLNEVEKDVSNISHVPWRKSFFLL